MALFLTIALTIWAVVHAYVFWRLASLPWVMDYVSPVVVGVIAALLWLSYFVARVLDRKGLQRFAWPLEMVASTWVGVVFLLFACLLVADVLTMGGTFFGSHTITIRAGAVALAGLLCMVG